MLLTMTFVNPFGGDPVLAPPAPIHTLQSEGAFLERGAVVRLGDF